MSTLAVIPARAGSRGLPGKHLLLVGGSPMIVHTIRAGLAAGSVDRVVVSTNDAAVARVARRAGVEVLSRPGELAQDDSPTVPAIQHAVQQAEAHGERFELVVTLQPTAPLRTAEQIDAAIALLGDPLVRSAVSVCRLGMPIRVIGMLANGRVRLVDRGTDARRQASPPAVRLTGGIYVTRRDLLDEGRLLDDRPAGLVLDEASGLDVDTAADLAEARRLSRVRRR
ncbi:MAG: acylneuraminate cytidylyltransferase family protein [Chloroflexota bacterium]